MGIGVGKKGLSLTQPVEETILRFLGQTSEVIVNMSDEYSWRSHLEATGIGARNVAPIETLDTLPPWLVPERSDAEPMLVQPSSEPALHRKFAALGPDKEAIQAFAATHGLLGLTVRLCERVTGPGTADSDRVTYTTEGESLARWRYEIGRLALAIAVWDLLKESHGGRARLKPFIIWQGDDAIMLWAGIRWLKGRWELVPLDRHSPPVIAPEAFHFGKVPWELLDTEYRQRLSEEPAPPTLRCAEPLLKPLLTEDLHVRTFEAATAIWAQMVTRLAWHRSSSPTAVPWLQWLPGTSRPEVVLLTNHLLTAIWNSFVLEVTGARPFAVCKYCGSWFSKEDPRQVYCQAKCKQREWRRRRAPGSQTEKAGGIDRRTSSNCNREESENVVHNNRAWCVTRGRSEVSDADLVGRGVLLSLQDHFSTAFRPRAFSGVKLSALPD